MKKFLPITALLSILLPCCSPGNGLQDGDLVFRVADSDAFSTSIVEATRSPREQQFDHVGIYAEIEGRPSIIEACPSKGVAITPLKDFLADSPAGTCCLRLTEDCDIPAALQRALSHLGEGYDWHFRENNGLMYCSELVYESFLRADGSHIFPAAPMNFLDSNGALPEFWAELFARLGEELPQGKSGTNPNGIAASELLEVVELR